ncbi:unnamed protein product [Brassica oleracea]
MFVVQVGVNMLPLFGLWFRRTCCSAGVNSRFSPALVYPMMYSSMCNVGYLIQVSFSVKKKSSKKFPLLEDPSPSMWPRKANPCRNKYLETSIEAFSLIRYSFFIALIFLYRALATQTISLFFRYTILWPIPIQFKPSRIESSHFTTYEFLFKVMTKWLTRTSKKVFVSYLVYLVCVIVLDTFSFSRIPW